MKLYTSGASSLGDSPRTVEKDTSLPLRSVYLQSSQNSGRGLATGLGAIG